jgi:hypothetical protein
MLGLPPKISADNISRLNILPVLVVYPLMIAKTAHPLAILAVTNQYGCNKLPPVLAVYHDYLCLNMTGEAELKQLEPISATILPNSMMTSPMGRNIMLDKAWDLTDTLRSRNARGIGGCVAGSKEGPEIAMLLSNRIFSKKPGAGVVEIDKNNRIRYDVAMFLGSKSLFLGFIPYLHSFSHLLVSLS